MKRTAEEAAAQQARGTDRWHPQAPLGFPTLVPRLRPASQGHRMQDPGTHPKSPLWPALGKKWDALSLAQPWASPRYLLYQLPPSPPPSWLHSDDDALGHPVLGRGARQPRCLLRLWLDAQPTLQLCDEPLLGRGSAQGGRVQPAAWGGLPGHGVCVACLPAPPDHRADLGGGGEAVTVPLGVVLTLLSPHSGAPGREGQNEDTRAASPYPTLISKSVLTLSKTLPPAASASPPLKWGCSIFLAALQIMKIL